MRHVKLIPSREINAAALGDLIDAAYADIQARVAGTDIEVRVRSPNLKAPAQRLTVTTFADVREIAHSLPGVVDGTSYGTPALKVGGKLIARMHQDMDCIVLRTDLLDREILMQSAPEAFFITDHYRDYPWILVRLGVVEKRVLPDLIERAWRFVASKPLIKKHDSQRQR